MSFESWWSRLEALAAPPGIDSLARQVRAADSRTKNLAAMAYRAGYEQAGKDIQERVERALRGDDDL